MASNLFSVFSGLASVWGLLFDICENGLSVVRNRFRPGFLGLALVLTAKETFRVQATSLSNGVWGVFRGAGKEGIVLRHRLVVTFPASWGFAMGRDRFGGPV